LCNQWSAFSHIIKTSIEICAKIGIPTSKIVMFAQISRKQTAKIPQNYRKSPFAKKKGLKSVWMTGTKKIYSRLFNI
jgi:hypothetical protein